jgi:porphobilinogen synthase
MPFFVRPGSRVKEPISTLPGQYRFSPDRLLTELDAVSRAGLLAIMLFGVPDRKDTRASGACSRRGIVQQAIRLIKKKFPRLVVIADTCLCEYMSHGHCGVIRRKNGGYEIANDETLKILGRTAVSQAEAGADVIAPSDMMDGRVRAVRNSLDRAGLSGIPILSYAAKYASSFYGPFREAAHSSPSFGDRKTYQMHYANRKEALKEIESDIEEGADMVMVKPALAYLDILRDAREKFGIPLAAFNVSGEYAFVKWAAANGWNERELVLEILTSIHRAGAGLVITYHAQDAARWLS